MLILKNAGNQRTLVCKVSADIFQSVFEAIMEDVSEKSDSKYSFVPWITNLSKNQ